jgi:hypothetical protein
MHDPSSSTALNYTGSPERLRSKGQRRVHGRALLTLTERPHLPRSACLCWWWDGCMVPERSVAACSRQDTCQPSPGGAGKLHHQVGVVNAASLSMRPAMSSWTASAGRAPSTVNIHSRPA